MATDARIDALYESTLKPRLAALEGHRREVKRYVRNAAIVVGTPAVLLWGHDLFAWLLPGGFRWLAIAVPLVGVFVGVFVAGTKFLMPGYSAYANYRTKFKHDVAAEVFRIVCPTADYAPMKGITREVFDESGLFNTTGGFSSDDRVRGRIGQTPFEAAEARRSYRTSGKNSRTVTVFHGLFFHLDFNKTLRGVTFVDPKRATGSSVGSRSDLSKIALESPEFAEQFTVYASDEVEARYILTPSMIQRILAVQSRTDRPVHLAFRNNRAYLGVNYERALFEPGIRDSTSAAAIHEMASHFALAEGIVQELDLNTRIWTKGIDDSFLTVEPPDDADAFEDLAQSGDLTPEKLLAAAIKAGGGTDDSDEAADAALGAPASTSITIEHTPGGVTVDYGFGVGFYIALVVWVATVAVTLAAARELGATTSMTWLASLTGWIPEIPYASAVVTTLPIAWFVGGWILWPIVFTMWAARVHAVEIAPEEVRIWRGLRPVPRRYPRPLYGRVVRLENAVYVGKTGGLNLLNASASPMLAAGEAPWVATALRRAMRGTAR